MPPGGRNAANRKNSAGNDKPRGRKTAVKIVAVNWNSKASAFYRQASEVLVSPARLLWRQKDCRLL